jgi:hypothetical protein
MYTERMWMECFVHEGKLDVKSPDRIKLTFSHPQLTLDDASLKISYFALDFPFEMKATKFGSQDATSQLLTSDESIG